MVIKLRDRKVFTGSYPVFTASLALCKAIEPIATSDKSEAVFLVLSIILVLVIVLAAFSF